MPFKALQARRKIAARLLLFALLMVCGGTVWQGAELALPVQTAVTLSAGSAVPVRSLPDGNGEKWDINQATAEQLCQVYGIGPTIAQRILDTREALGGFYFLEEVRDVSGVGEKRYAALAEMFYCPTPGAQH